MTEEIFEEVGIQTPDFSIAQSINKLSNPKGRATKILSNLKRSDVKRLTYMYSLQNALSFPTKKQRIIMKKPEAKADDIKRAEGYYFIIESAEHELDLHSSVSRKGTRGRDDLVTIAQESKKEQRGVLASFKEKISDFFSS